MKFVTQSRAEKKILGGTEGNVVHPAIGNVQQLGGQQLSWNNGTFKRGWVLREGWQQQRGAASRLMVMG